MTTFLLAYADLTAISWLFIALIEPELTTIVLEAFLTGWGGILTGRDHE